MLYIRYNQQNHHAGSNNNKKTCSDGIHTHLLFHVSDTYFYDQYSTFRQTDH